MRNLQFPVFVVVGLTLLACGTVPANALNVKAITAKPTADNPQYENKEAWPTLVGDEYFIKEKWPKTRLLIWARPGWPTRTRVANGWNPEHWIDAATGKPADTLPDMDTDLIIPDSDEPYWVNIEGVKQWACRHLTVGRNVNVIAHVGGNLKVFGNLWIRETGNLNTWRGTDFTGGSNTFIRYDWPSDGKLKKMHDERVVTPYDPDPKAKNPWMCNRLAVYLGLDKAPGTSAEVVGHVHVLDEVAIKSGSLIVGRDSRFITSGPASITVNRHARVVLMDGAHCSHGMNQMVCTDLAVKAGGEVTGGAPDRPLRRDAYLGIGYANWMNLPIRQLDDDTKPIPTTKDGKKLYYGYGRYNALIDGDLTGYPAAGSDARLVVCWQRIAAGGAGHWGRTDEAFQKVFPTIPPKIGVWISPDTNAENVRFDDLQFGGIVTESMETFKNWKNVSFGDGCLSTDPQDLVRGYKAELADREKARPQSILDPKEPFITMPKESSR